MEKKTLVVGRGVAVVRRYANAAGVAAVAMTGATMAHATGGGIVDVSSAVNELSTDGQAALIAVGGALVTLAAIAAVYKWSKAMFFG